MNLQIGILHNRYQICSKNNLTFDCKHLPFDSRDDVKLWILRNQLARRNLTAYQRGEIALGMAKLFEDRAKVNQANSTGGKNPQLLPNSVKAEPVNTQRQVAAIAGVGHDTMGRIKKIDEQADDDTKAKLRKGDVSVNQVYKSINGAIQLS